MVEGNNLHITNDSSYIMDLQLSVVYYPCQYLG